MQGSGISVRIAVVVACVFAQLAAIGHHVLVEHTRCAAHGEMIHGREHAGHGAAPLPEGAAEDRVVAGELDHGDAHEHCTATCDRRKAALLAVAAGDLSAAPCTEVPVLQAAPRRATPKAIYRFAPKTSPPV